MGMTFYSLLYRRREKLHSIRREAFIWDGPLQCLCSWCFWRLEHH